MCNGAFLRKSLIALIAIALLLYAPLVAIRILYPLRFTGLVAGWARERSLDPALVAAVIRVESRFHPDAVSPRGAIGLMQITPLTGRWIAGKLGVTNFTPNDLYDPETNVRFGTWYLVYLLDRFGEMETALRAYNAGPGTVAGWGSDPGGVYPETSAYVKRVIDALFIYRLYFRLPFLIRIIPSLGLSVAERRSVG